MQIPFFIREMPIFFKIFSSFWILFFFSIIPLFFIYRYWYFLRDPRRKIPKGNNIVAPADGYIIYIKEIKNKEVPISIKNGEKIYLKELMDDSQTNYNLVIGIFMTPFSVHQNRIPFSGKIIKNHYRQTNNNKSMNIGFLNLFFKLKPFTKGANYILDNERNTLVLKNDKIEGAVVQIADKWVRHIKNGNLKIGDDIEKGYKFGMIRMGSQCDLFLNIKSNYKIVVKERDYVKAGSDILIELE